MGEAPTGRLSVWALVCVGLIVAMTALVYSNSLGVPFLFDDHPSIEENTTLRQLGLVWPVLLYPPGGGSTVQGRPVLNLSFALNYAWGGLEVFGYHLANIAIHSAAAVVLFDIVRRTLLLPGMPPWAGGRALGLALVAALVWAAHPLQTAAVTYVAQRAESLAGLWYLLTLYGLVAGSQSARPWPWYLLSMLSCALGMATKEVLVTAPLLLLVYDRAFLSPSFRQALSARAWLYAGLALTAGIVLALSFSAGGRGGTAGFGAGVSPWEYLCTQFGFIARYLCLCFWPGPLVFDYGTPLATEASEVVPYAAVVVALAAAALVAFRYSPAVGFLGVAFFLLLAPSSSIVPVATQTAAEHRMYLALAPVVLLVVLAADWALGRSGAAPVVVAVVVVAALGARTYARNWDYRTEEAIWLDVIEKRPDNFRARLALSKIAQEAGQMDRAFEECDEAIRLRADDWLGYAARGNLLRVAGRPEEAMEDYDRAVALDDGGGAYGHRAEFFLKQGQFSRAAEDLTEAIRRVGDNAERFNSRGVVLMFAGQYQPALMDLDRAVALSPDKALYRHNRAGLHARMGQARAALADYTEAIRLDPSMKEPWASRAELRLMTGDLNGAAEDVKRAGALGPPTPALLYCRGLLHYKRKEFGPAIDDLNALIRKQPASRPAYQLRAFCHLGRGDLARAREDAAAIERLGGQPDPELARALKQGQ